MFKNLYKKCLDLAGHKSSKYYLAIVSFVESSFFPIPPDVMVIPMVISKKTDFKKIFLITTIFSVLGGMLGYVIGAFFFEFGAQIMNFYGYENKLNIIKESLIRNDGFYAWLGILFLAGFTPLPYKVFTIASGLIGFNFLIFVFISLISRGLRFFLVSYLSYKFGDLFNEFMKTVKIKKSHNDNEEYACYNIIKGDSNYITEPSHKKNKTDEQLKLNVSATNTKFTQLITAPNGKDYYIKDGTNNDDKLIIGELYDVESVERAIQNPEQKYKPLKVGILQYTDNRF